MSALVSYPLAGIDLLCVGGGTDSMSKAALNMYGVKLSRELGPVRRRSLSAVRRRRELTFCDRAFLCCAQKGFTVLLVHPGCAPFLSHRCNRDSRLTYASCSYVKSDMVRPPCPFSPLERALTSLPACRTSLTTAARSPSKRPSPRRAFPPSLSAPIHAADGATSAGHDRTNNVFLPAKPEWNGRYIAYTGKDLPW